MIAITNLTKVQRSNLVMLSDEELQSVIGGGPNTVFQADQPGSNVGALEIDVPTTKYDNSNTLIPVGFVIGVTPPGLGTTFSGATSGTLGINQKLGDTTLGVNYNPSQSRGGVTIGLAF